MALGRLLSTVPVTHINGSAPAGENHDVRAPAPPSSQSIASMHAPSRRQFAQHLIRQTGYAASVVVASLALGTFGYRLIAHLAWVDAFENAAMLLGGMGPVGEVKTTAGKIFSGVFALYAGLVFLAVTAFVLTPVFHYVLHKFHWETKGGT